jgi:hypothetical protein
MELLLMCRSRTAVARSAKPHSAADFRARRASQPVWACPAFPVYGRNDRVRCQACFQAVPVRSMALSVTTSLRMQAVSASFEGFPAWRSRS